MTAEVDRLRSKLVLEEFDDMPPLTPEILGLGQKEGRPERGRLNSLKLNESTDNQQDSTNQEF